MSKSSLIQIILLTIIIIIIAFTYLKYFYEPSNKLSEKIIEEEEEKIVKELAEVEKNIIKEIKYINKDEDTTFEIYAKNGSMDYEKKDIINMNEVTSKIVLEKKKETITITSDKAAYNTINYDTKFSGNIIIEYLNNIVRSEFLDLSIEDNLVALYGNIYFKNNTTTLMADRLEIDLITNDSKIFMLNNEDKIKILSSAKWQ